MKKLIIALVISSFALTACKQKLPEPVNLEASDKDVSIKILFNEVDKLKRTYYGELELKNNSAIDIKFPDWRLRFCVKNNQHAYIVSFQAAPKSKKPIDGDKENVIAPNSLFSHKIMVKVGNGEKIEDFQAEIINELYKTDAEFLPELVTKCS